MHFVKPGPMSTMVFLLIVAFVIIAFIRGVHRAYRATGGPALRATLYATWGVLLWLAATSLLVRSGFAEARPMPRLLIFLGVMIVAVLATGLSPLGARLSAGLSLSALVGFQAFRLPLELVLHAWAQQGSIPATMTWTGSNFDVVSGALALVLAPLARKDRRAAWIFNGVGLALLINVMHVVVRSSPLPFAWKVDPPLQLGFHLPYAWIATVCVAGALLGHVVLTRALLRKPG